MSKTKSVFVCQNCGQVSPKWAGRCPACQEWNTLVETSVVAKPNRRSLSAPPSPAEPVKASQVFSQKTPSRLSSEISELDRVLGGGLVAGQAVLFAGEPGIGKSTLLTQLSLTLPASQKKVVYICGEESPQQVGLRLNRLKLDAKPAENILLLPETDVDAALAFLEQKPSSLSLVIVDSIQTLTTTDLSGTAGSIGQVRESSQRLINWAKKASVPLLLVGHITKQGAVAGPKVLEHAVDTVIYFEGERFGDLRVLRAVKNRFGPTDEVGVFRMTGKGLYPFDQEQLVSAGGPAKTGAALTIIAEGSRLMTVEIQALVTQSFTPLPKRVITGLERGRAEMLIAVCQKYLRLPLFKYDIFLNVAGGIKINEPAADLAVCAALWSSYRNKPLVKKSCFLGEVSLLGEISPLPQLEKRSKQAAGVGLTQIFSCHNLPHLSALKDLAN